jgi:hypothetical protein
LEIEMPRALTYPLLLDLYKGKGGVVEHLSDDEREALRVETPLFEFIREAARTGRPRHVFLTGNAGDGKTFAILTADATGFTPITDASARDEGEGIPPIEALAERLDHHLRSGARLLVAINRGQLDRLDGVAGTGGRWPALAALLAGARPQARLEAVWPAAEEGNLALVDLGLLDTIAPTILGPMLDRLAAAITGCDLAPPTALAFSVALSALREPRVRRWIEAALLYARAEGHRATLREIWSFVAYLATGARAPSDGRPADVRDAVGARLFSEGADGPLFDAARRALDPAARPDPDLARALILGRLPEALGAVAGLGPLLTADPLDRGRVVQRAVHVHDRGRPLPEGREDRFSAALHALEAPGWHDRPSLAERLLSGIYTQLRLPVSRRVFPAWETLCYDSVRIPAASSVASAELDVRRLRLAVPRPAPVCQRALAGAWRAPFLWLSVDAEGHTSAARALRLTPRRFQLLDDPSGPLEPTEAELFTLRQWISSAQASARHDGRAIEVGAAQAPEQWLSLERDFLSGQVQLRWTNA